MTEPQQPVLQHTRTTRSEGLRALVRALLVGGVLLAAPLFLQIHRDSPVFFWACQVICGVIFCFFVVGYAVPNLRLHGHYRLCVFPDRIECESPHPSFGPSYRIEFREIQFIEHDTRGEGTNIWTIVTQTGDRIFLSHNYGNPVSRIVGLIQSARPELEVRDAAEAPRRIRSLILFIFLI